MSNPYYRKIAKPQDNLVYEGIPLLGNFSGAFTKVNPLDVDTLWGMKPPPFLKYLRLKERQSFQLWYKDYFATGAVYNAKWFGVVVFSVFNFKTREKYHAFNMLPPFKAKLAQGLFNSQSKAKMGSIELLIKNNLELNRIQLEGISTLDDIKLSLIGFHITEPAVLCAPVGKNSFAYSHKCLMPCEGSIKLTGKTQVVNRNETLMLFTDEKGFLPFKNSSETVSCAWFDREGNYYGFNLSRNQYIDPETYNENCFWVNGKLHVLPPVEFKIEAENNMWHIKDKYEMVNINFKIISQNNHKTNLGFIKSECELTFGTFSGIIKNTHHTLRLNNTNGMGELRNEKL